jgi:hypothetical protein
LIAIVPRLAFGHQVEAVLSITSCTRAPIPQANDMAEGKSHKAIVVTVATQLFDEYCCGALDAVTKQAHNPPISSTIAN